MQFLGLFIPTDVLAIDEEVGSRRLSCEPLEGGDEVSIVGHFADWVLRVRSTEVLKEFFQGCAVLTALLRKNHYLISSDTIGDIFICQLRRRCVRRNVAFMEAALLLRGLLPPPPALTFVLVGDNGAGARLAANGDVAQSVQGVVRDLCGADGGPHFRRGDVCQGIVLDEDGFVGSLEGRIGLNDGDGGTSARALVLPLARDPGGQGGELATQRTYLANAAALLVTVLVEGEEALLVDEFGDLCGLREGVLDLDAVVLLYLCVEAVGLGVETARVESEDTEGFLSA